MPPMSSRSSSMLPHTGQAPFTSRSSCGKLSPPGYPLSRPFFCTLFPSPLPPLPVYHFLISLFFLTPFNYHFPPAAIFRASGMNQSIYLVSKLWPNLLTTCFCKGSFTGAQLSPSIYLLFISAFLLQWQSWIVKTETIRLAKLKFSLLDLLQKMVASLWFTPLEARCLWVWKHYMQKYKSVFKIKRWWSGLLKFLLCRFFFNRKKNYYHKIWFTYKLIYNEYLREVPVK